MNKPDFFIVGAPKCGTTALYSYLKEHPEIFMSAIKEPEFFAADILGDLREIRRWDDYLKCFVPSSIEKRIGEATVWYLGSMSAAKEIKAFSPAAQIIIMLRNPVDVMYALHSTRLFGGREHLASFEAALEAEERGKLASWRCQGSRVIGLGYRETAKFSEQVRRYFATFGREKVHVIIYDDFRRDTGAVYKATLRFLDVRPDFQPGFRVIYSNRRARSQGLQELLRHPPQVVRRFGRAMIPLPLRSFLGDCVFRLNAVHEPRSPMSPELRSRLQKEFEPEVEQLSILLNRDLSAWCSS